MRAWPALGDVGSKDADLAVFDATGAATILGCDPSGVATAFREAAFIEHQHRKDGLGWGRGRGLWRGEQGGDNQGAQDIAHGILVPDGAGEQTLDAIGMQQTGVFSDLPAVFPGDLTEDGLQVEQSMPTRLGTGKAGGKALMEQA